MVRVTLFMDSTFAWGDPDNPKDKGGTLIKSGECIAFDSVLEKRGIVSDCAPFHDNIPGFAVLRFKNEIVRLTWNEWDRTYSRRDS